MSYDPDEYAGLPDEIAKLDKALAKLHDCDLAEWDQDFVDDLTDRIATKTLRVVTPRQWEQIERMKGKHNVEE